jgi:hypothetical protein
MRVARELLGQSPGEKPEQFVPHQMAVEVVVVLEVVDVEDGHEALLARDLLQILVEADAVL